MQTHTQALSDTPLLVPFSLLPSLLADEGTFVAVAFVPQYVSAGVVGITSGYLLDRYVPETLAPGEVRRPEMLWGIVAFASFVTPILLVFLKTKLFVEEPTLQTDTQSVAVRRGPSGSKGRAHGKYAMAIGGESELTEASDTPMSKSGLERRLYPDPSLSGAVDDEIIE